MYAIVDPRIYNEIMRKSHKQRLVIKEHTVMHTHSNFMFKLVFSPVP